MSDLTNALARIANSAALATEKSKTARLMLYGPSGVGKSTIAAMILRTLINKDDGLIIQIDTSEGWVSWQNHEGLSDGILVIPFTTFEDLQHIADGIKQKIAPFDRVKGVILDEGSKMAEIDVIRVLKARREGAYGTKFQASAGAITEGPDYQIALERFRSIWFNLMDNRDIHVVCLAHQQDKKDRQGNIVSVFPAFSPKIAQASKELLHLSAHIVGTVTADLSRPGEPVYKRVAQVHPSIMVDAKCRMDIRETSIDADELPYRIKAWLGKGGESHKDNTIRPEVHSNEKITSAIDGVLLDESPETLEALASNDDVSDVSGIGNIDLASLDLSNL